jgi:hypothetical protein
MLGVGDNLSILHLTKKSMLFITPACRREGANIPKGANIPQDIFALQ